LPDEVLGCLITLILFHCDLSGNSDIFAILPNDIQFFVDEQQEMGMWDLYQAIRRARTFDNAHLVIVPLVEKKMKDDSGHWLLFAIDLNNDKIYLFDPCNEFIGSYGACDMLKKVFLGPYLSYKA